MTPQRALLIVGSPSASRVLTCKKIDLLGHFRAALLPYVGMALVLWGIPLLPVAVLALLAALVYEACNKTRRPAVVALS